MWIASWLKDHFASSWLAVVVVEVVAVTVVVDIQIWFHRTEAKIARIWSFFYFFLVNSVATATARQGDRHKGNAAAAAATAATVNYQLLATAVA